MKKAIVFLLALTTLAAVLPAATDDIADVSPRRRSRAQTEAAPAEATPAPDQTNAQSSKSKRKFSLWPFSRRAKPEATPEPTPMPSPTPRKPRKRVAKPSPSPSPGDVSEEKSSAEAIPAKKSETKSASPTPAPVKKTESPTPAPTKKKTGKKNAESSMNDQVPFVSQPSQGTEGGNGKTIGGDGSAKNAAPDETARFEQARTKALADKQVKQLQDKADNAVKDEDQRKASKEYYKALYSRMRKIDPSLKESIDRTEAVTMKRLDRGVNAPPSQPEPSPAAAVGDEEKKDDPQNSDEQKSDAAPMPSESPKPE